MNVDFAIRNATTADSRIRRAVVEAYRNAGDKPVKNTELYADVARRAGLTAEQAAERRAFGVKNPEPHLVAARTARWAQQSMKRAGLLEKAGARGVWRLTTNGKQTLHRIERGCGLVAFSTRLGAALWCDVRDAYRGLEEPVWLVLTSPPYALAKTRGYDSPRPEEWVDFICAAVEAISPKLADGASIALNIGADIFEPGSPARRLLPERLSIALHERLGLWKMDTLIWHAPCKPPGPIHWASKNRVHLNVGWEPVLWFSNNPHKVRSNNQRVLRPHTERHARRIASGGETVARNNSDGAYRRPVGAFSNPTAGAIPRNVLTFGTTCHSQRAYKTAARELGLPVHGAPFPLSLAKFLVEFLTEAGQLVTDPFGGSITTGLACEQLGRRWLCVDIMAEYLAGAATRFADAWVNPEIDLLLGVRRGATATGATPQLI